jgi:hypothetical protein
VFFRLKVSAGHLEMSQERAIKILEMRIRFYDRSMEKNKQLDSLMIYLIVFIDGSLYGLLVKKDRC